MIIESAELENIACYQKRSFDFSPSLTVVYGENRSGKSTLVHALFFGLFGEHLNPSLTPADLCRKGMADGSATVFFNNEDKRYQLRRSTAGIPTLRISSPEKLNGTWEPVPSFTGNPVESPVGVPPAVAALTSFFQEGEIQLFLKEIPKYSRTLLQHVIRMDEVFIVQSRLKRCLSLAKEVHSQTEKKHLSEFVDMGRMTAAAEAVEALEKEMAFLQKEHQGLIRVEMGQPDPETSLKMKRLYETAEQEAGRARRMREQMPSLGQLETQKQEIEENIRQNATDEAVKENLQNEIGALSARISDATAQLGRLSSLVDSPACPTCGQTLANDPLTESIRQVKERLTGWESQKPALEKSLLEWNRQFAVVQEGHKQLEKIRIQMESIGRLDRDYQRIEEERTQAREALSEFEATYPEKLQDAETRLARIRESESRLAAVQRKLIEAKVTLAQHVDTEKRRIGRETELNALERERLVCHVAHRAVEDAIQGLTRELMGRVRESLTHWTGFFSFLEEFDIGVTPSQLSPIIQAKGYAYKLNQMSKSERIFLYLMLKLAIGDALSQLGVFILDDPADGLDTKRKAMMAELLKEVARKRQVLITTNDSGFADLFSSETRIQLA